MENPSDVNPFEVPPPFTPGTPLEDALNELLAEKRISRKIAIFEKIYRELRVYRRLLAKHRLLEPHLIDRWIN